MEGQKHYPILHLAPLPEHLAWTPPLLQVLLPHICKINILYFLNDAIVEFEKEMFK